MITGVLIALLLALFSYALSGARNPAYLLYYLAFVPFLTFDTEAGGLTSVEGLASPSVLLKLALRLALVVGFLLLAVRNHRALCELLRPRSTPVVALILWAALGVTRAQDPVVSFLRLGELGSFFLAGVVLFSRASSEAGPRSVARWHVLALLTLPLTALLFLALRPELVFYERADGIGRLGHRLLNSNSLGFACVGLILWAQFELVHARERLRHVLLERGLPFLVLVPAAYVLLASRSRTALLALLIGSAVLWFPYSPRRPLRMGGFVLVGLAVLIACALNLEPILAWLERGEPASGLVTGTGRTSLWSALLSEQVPRAPLLGAGYLMLSADGSFLHNGVFWNNAHNTYVYALVSTGFPGLLCVLAIVLLPLAATLRRVFVAAEHERSEWTLLLALQGVVTMTCVTGFGVFGHPNPAMFFHYAIFSYALGYATRPAVSRHAMPSRARDPEAALTAR